VTAEGREQNAFQPQDSAINASSENPPRPMRWVVTWASYVVITTDCIIGAGVAGPAIGLALHRAGIQASSTNLARRRETTRVAFWNLPPNGIAVLRALGVEHVMDGSASATIA